MVYPWRNHVRTIASQVRCVCNGLVQSMFSAVREQICHTVSERRRAERREARKTESRVGPKASFSLESSSCFGIYCTHIFPQPFPCFCIFTVGHNQHHALQSCHNYEGVVLKSPFNDLQVIPHAEREEKWHVNIVGAEKLGRDYVTETKSAKYEISQASEHMLRWDTGHLEEHNTVCLQMCLDYDEDERWWEWTTCLW